MIHNFLHSVDLLTDACRRFREFCVEGLEPNREQIDEHLGNSLMLVTALNPHDRLRQRGRDRQEGAQERGPTLREAALALGHLTGRGVRPAVRPEEMIAGPGSEPPAAMHDLRRQDQHARR